MDDTISSVAASDLQSDEIYHAMSDTDRQIAAMKRIKSDIKSVWDEVIRLSDGWKVIQSCGIEGKIVIGPNTVHVESKLLMIRVCLG